MDAAELERFGARVEEFEVIQGVSMQTIYITGAPCHQGSRRCRLRTVRTAAAPLSGLAAAACPCGSGALLRAILLPGLASSHAALHSASSSATNITWAASQHRSSRLENRLSRAWIERIVCDNPAGVMIREVESEPQPANFAVCRKGCTASHWWRIHIRHAP